MIILKLMQKLVSSCAWACVCAQEASRIPPPPPEGGLRRAGQGQVHAMAELSQQLAAQEYTQQKKGKS